MRLRLRRLALLALAAILLAGCAGARYKPTPETDALRRGIVLDALGQIGRPYRYGGTVNRSASPGEAELRSVVPNVRPHRHSHE